MRIPPTQPLTAGTSLPRNGAVAIKLEMSITFPAISGARPSATRKLGCTSDRPMSPCAVAALCRSDALLSFGEDSTRTISAIRGEDVDLRFRLPLHVCPAGYRVSRLLGHPRRP